MPTISTAGSTDNVPTSADDSGFAPPTAEEKAITGKVYPPLESPSKEFYDNGKRIDPVVTANLTKLADRVGLSLEARATEKQGYYAMLRDERLYGLDQDAVIPELLHTAWTEARMKAAQPGVSDVDADAAQVTMNEATRRALREQLGDHDFEELLARVQKFGRQHPTLAEILRDPAVGSRLDVLQALISFIIRVNFR